MTAIEESQLIFTTKLGKKKDAFFHLLLECKRQRSPLCHNCLKLDSKGSGLLMLVWAFHQGGWSQSCFKRSCPLEDQTQFFFIYVIKAF